MKYTANILTSLRIVCAIIMLFAAPFSALFWICYGCAGVSDIFDGIAARLLRRQSNFGATFDSVADAVFAGSVAAVVILYVKLPAYLWANAALIAVCRLCAYGIGYCKYHTFSALHTYLNKASGIMLFAFPLLYASFGIMASGLFLCSVTLLSAVEELAITVQSKTLNRDCRSFFARLKPPEDMKKS